MIPGSKSILFFSILYLVMAANAFSQVQEEGSFHFQMPVGIHIMNSSFRPYTINYMAGLSMMHKLNGSKLSFDWGFTAALCPAKDNTEDGQGGNLYQPPNTGSEIVTIYAGLGRKELSGRNRLEYAAGASFIYTGFTPWYTPGPMIKRNTVGGYIRGGFQHKFSDYFSLGPFIAYSIYPAGTRRNIKLNPSNFSIGIILGP
jgi:hypothetical protein